MPNTPRPDIDARVAIVGAGPHGLAAALHLIERDRTLREELVVLDPAGRWLHTWDEQFRRLHIEHLRSPGVHHPGPDPHGLIPFSRTRDLESRLPYNIPTTEGFRRYCDHLVTTAGLEEHVTGTEVRDLVTGPYATTLRLGDGSTFTARHVVLAVNPARRTLPHWTFDALPTAPDRLLHAEDVDLRAARRNLVDAKVTVVGGGLTAGHLAVGAADAGAHVTLIARRAVRSSMFDTEPGWLGPLHLDAFHEIDDPEERLRRCLAARDGGSIPLWMIRRLTRLESTGRLHLLAPTRICGAEPGSGGGLTLVLGNEARHHADHVWLATGSRVDIAAHRLTATLQRTHPTRIIDGWPVLDHHLRWPGTNVHLMGRAAMLVLGPAAGNLWGARVAAVRIADHLAGPAGGAPRPTRHAPALPSTHRR